MKRKAAALLVTAGILALVGALWWPGTETPPSDPVETPVTRTDRAPPSPVGGPLPSSPERLRQDTRASAEAAPRSVWSTETTLAAFVTYGTDVSPFQDHQTAVELLCDADGVEARADLDGWVDTVLWEREARAGWAVARRATGAERARIVGLLARNAGMERCPLHRRLLADAGTSRELAPIAPLRGSPEGVASMDARFVDTLERGERWFD